MIRSFLWQKNKPPATDVSRAEMLAALKDKDALLWVDLESPTEFEDECLVEIFNFHPLAVEDCLTEHSDPKVDDYDEYLFLVMHAVTLPPEGKPTLELAPTEVHLFFGKNYVVTYHKGSVKTVDEVREMIRKKTSALGERGTDFLVHSILDHLVDNYQPVLSRYDQKIDQLEEEIFNNPRADYLSSVMMMKRDVFTLRRTVGAQRDMVNFLTRNPDTFIREGNLMYYRDVYDHLNRIYGIAEGFHESLSSILQVYFSYTSHKVNEIVKHMTVLATLTMPAVLVASIYGMNFKHMPELAWKFGYPFSLFLALGISLVVLAWMKFKKWL